MVMTISSSGPVLLQTREDDKTVVKPYGETCPKNTNFATKIADKKITPPFCKKKWPPF